MKKQRPMAREKKRYWLTFDTESTTQPLIWEMSRRFDIIFNIRSSSVSDTVGITAVELEGPVETIGRAVQWFKRKGVQVDPVELNTIEG
jgi:ABC-type methionine transport system ATPase subunit